MVRVGFCQGFFSVKVLCVGGENWGRVSPAAAVLATGSLSLLCCFEGCLVLPVAARASCERLEIQEQSLQWWTSDSRELSSVRGCSPCSFTVVVLLCENFLVLWRGCWKVAQMRQKLLFAKGYNLECVKTFQLASLEAKLAKKRVLKNVSWRLINTAGYWF